MFKGANSKLYEIIIVPTTLAVAKQKVMRLLGEELKLTTKKLNYYFLSQEEANKAIKTLCLPDINYEFVVRELNDKDIKKGVIFKTAKRFCEYVLSKDFCNENLEVIK